MLKNFSLFLLLLLTLSSCKNENKLMESDNVSLYEFESGPSNYNFEFKNNIYSGPKKSFKKKIKNVEEILGYRAVYLDSSLSSFKFGKWNIYYDNDVLKESGKYQIGRYVECCFTGPCNRYYNYKIGKWKFYYPNGNLKANVNFELTKLRIHTNCGGDYLDYGIIDEKSEFFDEQGKLITKNIQELKLELEKSMTHTHIDRYLIPTIENDTIITIKLKN
jgi:antitoxin component YwqK of YwqJK toxin-antitoxin module